MTGGLLLDAAATLPYWRDGVVALLACVVIAVLWFIATVDPA
jgi:hypothetical protein